MRWATARLPGQPSELLTDEKLPGQPSMIRRYSRLDRRIQHILLVAIAAQQYLCRLPFVRRHLLGKDQVTTTRPTRAAHSRLWRLLVVVVIHLYCFILVIWRFRLNCVRAKGETGMAVSANQDRGDATILIRPLVKPSLQQHH
jgi:hypothetical protein